MSKPPTFWPASETQWRLPEELVFGIDGALSAPLPVGISKLARHNRLQHRLAELGEQLGFQSKLEVPTGYRRWTHSGRFDVVWTPIVAECPMPIVFEIDSCWRHESLLKLGRVGEDAFKLWIYYGQRPRPLEPTEPGFRRLNILRIEPWRLGVRDGRRVVELAPGPWPEPLFPRLAHSVDR